MRQFLTRFFIFLLLISLGCAGSLKASGQSDIVIAEVFYQSVGCSGLPSDPVALWMDDEETYSDFFQGLAGQTIGNDIPTPPSVDFTRYGMLLVCMGQKNTGGYSLGLKTPSVRIVDKTAFIHVDWIEPPPEALLPQMTTCPHLLIRLPKSDFAFIEVVDQNNVLRAATRISP